MDITPRLSDLAQIEFGDEFTSRYEPGDTDRSSTRFHVATFLSEDDYDNSIKNQINTAVIEALDAVKNSSDSDVVESIKDIKAPWGMKSSQAAQISQAARMVCMSP